MRAGREKEIEMVEPEMMEKYPKLSQVVQELLIGAARTCIHPFIFVLVSIKRCS